ncbi:exported hypothetical protein [Paraburkholderia tropica]|uniref:hypothetical protein n=1 Tax=Paraburkholderia tropica TaxID=92647 RepID=UPI001CB4BA08|nr:hypothetical protein [Paraburkholderia tropica]CAG9235652.1 exported hypothetical protein [Paraburkholderia tropica]
MKQVKYAALIALALTMHLGTASAAQKAEAAVPTASNGTIGQTPDDYEIAGVKRPMWGTSTHSMAYIARQNVYKGH